MTTKFCKKCQAETERGANDRCKPCVNTRNAAWKKANAEKVTASNQSYYSNNKVKALIATRAWQAANKDRVNANSRARIVSNNEIREKRNADARAWRIANPEKVKAYGRSWQITNAEKVRSLQREYYAKNKERVTAKNEKWSTANPDKVKEIKRNCRARKRNATGTHTAADIRNLMTLQKGKCPICKTNLKDSYHVDHVEPLAKGGSNDKLNLQLLCAPCNQSKSARNPVDFMQSKGFLL